MPPRSNGEFSIGDIILAGEDFRRGHYSQASGRYHCLARKPRVGVCFSTGSRPENAVMS